MGQPFFNCMWRLSSTLHHLFQKTVLRSRNRIILTQEEPEPEPYPWSRFRFRLRFRLLLQKKYQTKSTLTGHWLTHAWSCSREETRIMVTGRNFYHKNNLKFKGRNRNLNRSWNRNRGKKIGTRNRNLGKMARFRNTARRYQNPLANNLRVLATIWEGHWMCYL
jgi:hypothetical protein